MQDRLHVAFVLGNRFMFGNSEQNDCPMQLIADPSQLIYSRSTDLKGLPTLGNTAPRIWYTLSLPSI